ncbi:MAG: SusD/RagB family nutrient-binding outer membrane lipoprotein [Cytophagales bacterium]|nr:SusD/RagB family nutrient-binding outer membrane lipoprotein [Cytophagales bacterium]
MISGKSTKTKTGSLFVDDDLLMRGALVNIHTSRYFEYYFLHAEEIPFWTRMWTGSLSQEIFTQPNDATMWSRYYGQRQDPVRDLLYKYEKAENPEQYSHRKAMMLILDAFNTHINTDLYGASPYTKAFTARKVGEEIFYPEYDSQELIYKTLISNLTLATQLLQKKGEQLTFENADMIWEGDPVKWHKFANSLKLRLAMRISKASPALSKSACQEVLADPVGIMNSDEDSFSFKFAPADGVAHGAHDVPGSQVPTDVIIDAMTTEDGVVSDPRARVFFTRSKHEKIFRGLGVNPSKRPDVLLDTLSQLNIRLWDPSQEGGATDMIETMFSHADARFLKAWAIIEHELEGDPEAEFNEGFKASVNEWFKISKYISLKSVLDEPLKPEEITKFVNDNKTGFPKTGTKEEKVKAIVTQICINNMKDMVECYALWRLTGWPSSEKIEIGNEEMKVPVRMPYPSGLETGKTKEAYEEAIAKWGGASIYDRVWWDVD